MFKKNRIYRKKKKKEIEEWREFQRLKNGIYYEGIYKKRRKKRKKKIKKC